MSLLSNRNSVDTSSNQLNNINFVNSVTESDGNAIVTKVRTDGTTSVETFPLTKSSLDPYFEYNSEKDRLVSVKPIETTLASLHLKDQMTLSTGFSNVCIVDHYTNDKLTPCFSKIEGNYVTNDPSASVSCLPPTGRVYMDRIEVERYGDPLDNVDAVNEFDEQVFINFCASAQAIEFIFGEDVTEDIELLYQNTINGLDVFEQLLPKQNYFKNQRYTLVFNNAMEICVNESIGEVLQFHSKICKINRTTREDVGFLLARSASQNDPISGSNKPYIKMYARPFHDKPLALKEDFFDASGNSLLNVDVTDLESRVQILENHHDTHIEDELEERIVAIESKMTKPSNGELIDIEFQRNRINSLEQQVLDLHSKINALMPE